MLHSIHTDLCPIIFSARPVGLLSHQLRHNICQNGPQRRVCPDEGLMQELHASSFPSFFGSADWPLIAVVGWTRASSLGSDTEIGERLYQQRDLACLLLHTWRRVRCLRRSNGHQHRMQLASFLSSWRGRGKARIGNSQWSVCNGCRLLYSVCVHWWPSCGYMFVHSRTTYT